MIPMPRSMVLILAGIVILGVIASVVAYRLTPEPPTHAEIADEVRRLSDEAGLDRAETEKRIESCAGIAEGYTRLWSGLVSARYETCLREAGLLE
jgi:hypothetical protein